MVSEPATTPVSTGCFPGSTNTTNERTRLRRAAETILKYSSEGRQNAAARPSDCGYRGILMRRDVCKCSLLGVSPASTSPHANEASFVQGHDDEPPSEGATQASSGRRYRVRKASELRHPGLRKDHPSKILKSPRCNQRPPTPLMSAWALACRRRCVAPSPVSPPLPLPT